jgi:glucose uptake protein GlcU
MNSIFTKKSNNCLIYVRNNKNYNKKKERKMKGVKILSGIITGLGAVFTTIAANEEGVSKAEKTGNVIFGLGTVAVGISGILSETAKEEREERQKVVEEIMEAANKRLKEGEEA